MKVKVNVKVETNAAANATFDITVGTSDTVSGVKEQVSVLKLIPFPEQQLLLDGKVLKDEQPLLDCGVKEGSSLDLTVEASEASLAQQLIQLLQARDLSADELGLLYSYKHGVSITQALKLLGHDGKLEDFFKKQKPFHFENGRVALVRQNTALKPFSVADEVVQILKANGSGPMDIKELCKKFVQKFNVSLSSVAGARPAEFLAKEKELFTIKGHSLVSLKNSTGQSQSKKQEAPEPAARVAKEAPKRTDGPPGLEPAVKAADLEVSGTVGSEQYVELHNRICAHSFTSKVAMAVKGVVDTVSESVFLNVDHIAKGGSVGKGTSISGVTDAEVVFFLQGLPAVGHEKWLPPLLKATAGVLSDSLSDGQGVESIRATEDSVQMVVKGLVTVDLRFSPIEESYAETIQTLGRQGPQVRRYYAASLVKQRTEFIARQPSNVKVTIRLMKWWRDQQQWSSKLVRPTDEILELITVYSAVQTKPSDQRMAIANVMSLLSRFNELRIVWTNYYKKEDIWASLLHQQPLLMDPTNPFVNVADPQIFDARELMTLARSTHFFW